MTNVLNYKAWASGRGWTYTFWERRRTRKCRRTMNYYVTNGHDARNERWTRSFCEKIWKKTFDTHVDGWIILSLTIKEYARDVLECIQLAPNRARINGEESCGYINSE